MENINSVANDVKALQIQQIKPVQKDEPEIGRQNEKAEGENRQASMAYQNAGIGQKVDIRV